MTSNTSTGQAQALGTSLDCLYNETVEGKNPTILFH